MGARDLSRVKRGAAAARPDAVAGDFGAYP
jgi:hypothetical protein